MYLVAFDSGTTAAPRLFDKGWRVLVFGLLCCSSAHGGAASELGISLRLDSDQRSEAGSGATRETHLLRSEGGVSKALSQEAGQSVAAVLRRDGDGYVIESRIEGAGVQSHAAELLDLSIELANPSTTDDLRLTLHLDARLEVAAGGGDTAADAALSLTSADVGQEIFPPLRLAADAYFGLEPAPVAHTRRLEIALAPGEVRRLQGRLDLQGGNRLLDADGDEGAFAAALSLRISVAGLSALRAPGDPLPVPMLSPWGLVLLGFLVTVLGWRRRETLAAGVRK